MWSQLICVRLSTNDLGCPGIGSVWFFSPVCRENGSWLTDRAESQATLLNYSGPQKLPAVFFLLPFCMTPPSGNIDLLGI